MRLSAGFAGPVWQVTVEDDGPGVPAAERERMFERFVRLSGTAAAADTPRGTGLGLAISRSIVRLHGGRIWAEPAQQLRGLAVVVELPRAATAVEAAREDA